MTKEEFIEKGFNFIQTPENLDHFQEWLSNALDSYREAIIDECVGVVPKADHTIIDKDTTHYEGIYTRCWACWEDEHFNNCRSQTIDRLNSLRS